MSSPVSKERLLFVILSVFAAAAILFFFWQFEFFLAPHYRHRFLISYTLFDLFICELLILLLIGQLVVSRSRLWRLLYYGLCSLFIFIYGLQALAVYHGNEFLSRLAYENMDHLYLLINIQTISAISFILLVAIAVPASAELLGSNVATARRSSRRIIVLLLIGIILTSTTTWWLPSSFIDKRDQILSNSQVDHSSPILSLYSVLFLHRAGSSDSMAGGQLSEQDLAEIKKFGFHFDRRSAYPLIKDYIYTSPPPFGANAVIEPESMPPNVIIFFAEGISARAVGAYGSRYADLTPNIDEFARSSMLVSRYYNHTAATYRGLLGQLCSLYPTHGGAAGWQTNFDEVAGTNYLSLADLFVRNGYEAIFLDAHHKDHRSRVDEMVAGLGFTTVLTGDELAKRYLENAAPLMEKAYSDGQYFDSIIGYLKDRQKDGEQTPFFMSLYNFGTHSFLLNSKDGVRYRQGGNSVLNNINNLDAAFGRFVDYLKASPYADNTIVIFTADHCHYYDNQFAAAFDGPDYQKIFVDTIPLIIHDPRHTLPGEYDAANASSIDFAPSLVHYFGFESTRNPFMGSSIFETKTEPYEKLSVAALGEREIFLIDGEKIHSLSDTGEYADSLKAIQTYLSVVSQLERSNRIWDK
jgi:phosphoglycerol transferase MdoB-like AlkP superfamily enzyme